MGLGLLCLLRVLRLRIDHDESVESDLMTECKGNSDGERRGNNVR